MMVRLKQCTVAVWPVIAVVLAVLASTTAASWVDQAVFAASAHTADADSSDPTVYDVSMLMVAPPGAGWDESTKADVAQAQASGFDTVSRFWSDVTDGRVNLRLRSQRWWPSEGNCSGNAAVTSAARDFLDYKAGPRSRVMVVVPGCSSSGSANGDLVYAAGNNQFELWAQKLGNSFGYGNASQLVCANDTVDYNLSGALPSGCTRSISGDGQSVMATTSGAVKPRRYPALVEMIARDHVSADDYVRITADATEQSVTFKPLTAAARSGPRGVVIRDPLSGQDYYVERRETQSGVRIMRSPGTSSSLNLPGPMAADGSRQPFWPAGSVFSSYTGALKIQVDWVDVDSVQITALTDSTAGRPFITSDAPPMASLDLPYHHQITATGSDLRFEVTAGALPDGLSLDETSGVISGSAVRPQDAAFTVTVTAAGGTTTADYTIRVALVPDSALLRCIATKAGVAAEDVTPAIMSRLTGTLTCTASQVASLAGAEHLTSISFLQINTNIISDVTPLRDLTQLTRLDIWSNRLTDLSPLAGLTRLTRLSANWNQITDVSPLASLTALTFLELPANPISDITALAGLTNLTTLNIWQMPITDISALSGLTRLVTLRVDQNQIVDLSPLGALPVVRTARVDGQRPTTTAVVGVPTGPGLRLPDGSALSDGNLSFDRTRATYNQADGFTWAEPGSFQTDWNTPVQVGTVTVPFTGQLSTTVVTTPPATGPMFSSGAPQTAGAGTSYQHQFRVSGFDTPPVFDIASGSLPPGLSLNTTTGLLTGTPTEVGRWDLTIVATSPTQSASQDITLVVNARAPKITSSPTLSAMAERMFRFQVTASGTGPITYSVVAGDLPAGLDLTDDTGVLSGRPTLAGTYTFTFAATGPRGVDHQDVTLTVEPVNPIQDVNLRACVAARAGVAPEALTVQAMNSLTGNLSCNNRSITSLNGAEHLTGITNLYLGDNTITDLSPLSGLTRLGGLEVYRNYRLKDLTPLAGMNLNDLSVYSTAVTDQDLGPLRSLPALTTVNLSGLSIQDLSPLSALTTVRNLYLSTNDISDLSPLTPLVDLQLLDINDNRVTDLRPIALLTQLTTLRATGQRSVFSPTAGEPTGQVVHLPDGSPLTSAAWTGLNATGSYTPQDGFTWSTPGDRTLAWTSRLTVGTSSVVYSGTVIMNVSSAVPTTRDTPAESDGAPVGSTPQDTEALDATQPAAPSLTAPSAPRPSLPEPGQEPAVEPQPSTPEPATEPTHTAHDEPDSGPDGDPDAAR